MGARGFAPDQNFCIFYTSTRLNRYLRFTDRSGSGKAKFDVSDEVQLLESKGMKIQELRKAQEIAEENVETIRSKWHEYFD